jgi:aminocarboxymuconate-semialdehyde decarboxylase
MSNLFSSGIDIHTHYVPAHFPQWSGKHIPRGWPSMTQAVSHGHDECCHRQIMIDGKHYRTVSEQCWNRPRRLADLPAMGVSQQVISPMPELLSYWLDAEHAQPLLRFINESIADVAAESNGALIGMAAVPLQDVTRAISELEYAITSLGLKGVELGSHVNGTPLSSPALRPFFEACAAMNVPIFVHALKPYGLERLVGPTQLQQVLGYPSDVGLAAASVITGNLLSSCPSLRIAFSHGGGTFSSLLPRLEQGWHTFPAIREQMRLSPTEQARKLYFDTLVFDKATLRHLVDKFGATQLMLGSDYPFNFQERNPSERVKECGFSHATAQALIRDNAERFLGMISTTEHKVEMNNGL